MSECSITKRIKLDEVENNNESNNGDVTVGSQKQLSPQFTTVSLSNDDAQQPRLNKITLVKINSSSPIKSLQSSPVKNAFIDSLISKNLSSPRSTGLAEATTTTTAAAAASTQPTVVSSNAATKRILTITSSNGTSISPSAFASSLNGNEKIHYVKIVNSTATLSSTTSSATPSSTNTSGSSIKITSVCSSSSTQEGTNNVRPAPISAIASTAVKPLIQKTTTTSTSTTSILAKSGGLCATITPVVASSSSSSSSAAANGTSTSSNEKQGEVDRDVSPPLSHSVVVNNHDQNSIQNHNDNSATLRSDQSPLKQPATTTTIQLINTPLPSTGTCLQLSGSQSQPQQRITITSPSKATAIASIGSVGSFMHKIQSLSTTTPPPPPPATTSSSSSAAAAPLGNYKVLAQQLPSALSIKTTAPGTAPMPLVNNRIVITKTISSLPADDTRKHILSAVPTSLVRVGDSFGVVKATPPPPPQSSTTQISLTPIANSSNLNAVGKIKTTALYKNEVEKHTIAFSSQQTKTQSRPLTQTLVSSLNNVFSNLNESSSLQQASTAAHITSHHCLNSVNSSLNNTSQASSALSNARKPCNCTKSMCLKLYCDCFAMGAFCHDCNCVNCFNTLEHEDERNKAIKLVLDRNPQAFQSKIGKFTQVALNKMLPSSNSSSSSNSVGLESLDSSSMSLKRSAIDDLDELHSRHVKGCNCKKSNCLKRYCECYLAKIQCSALCKCVGCKNCDEATRSLLELANAAADLRNKQQQQQQNQPQQLKFGSKKTSAELSSSPSQQPFGSLNLSNHSLNSRFSFLNGIEFMSTKDLDKQLSIYRSYESALDDSVIEKSCLRMISRASTELANSHKNEYTENASQNKQDEMIERKILEEFGACLTEIISNAEKRKHPYSYEYNGE